VSIGLVTVVHGDTYRAFLPEWIEAAARLETAPDCYGIVTELITSDLLSMVKDMPCSGTVIRSTTTFSHHPQVLVNEAIQACDTEWICKMDVDDLLLPHAFNHLPEDADILMFGIQVNSPQGAYNLLPSDFRHQDVLDVENNLVFSGSPFRKWLWHGNPFRDMLFEDWAFWIGCAKQQARFTASQQADYIYRLADHNISLGVDEGYWRAVVRSLK
jgi:hypothetical protein